MLNIIYRTTIGTFLLLLLPLLILLFKWNWHPTKHQDLLHIMYYITSTVSYPWIIITTLFLTMGILWFLRVNLSAAILVVVILYTVLCVEQCIKLLLKNEIHEPRPFVVWLEKKYGLNKNDFYKLTFKKRATVINCFLKNNSQIPQWLRRYWTIENDFSFPSGHTIFATSWLFFFIAIYQINHHRFIIIMILILFFWSIMIMSSRLLLGMHWPIDLCIATIISWISTNSTIALIKYFYNSFYLKFKIPNI